MDRIVLTKEEAAWFSRNLIKTKTILEAAGRKDPEALERQTYKTIVKLQKEAQEIAYTLSQLGDEPFEFEMILPRKLRSVVGRMIEATIKTLTDVVIPEYARRGAEFQEHQLDASRKVELLLKMRKKFK